MCLTYVLFSQDWVPTPAGKRTLFQAGLGEKKITFPKNTSPASLKDKLEEYYPQLTKGGGFELLRVSFTNRTALDLIVPPPAGYTSQFLSEESGLGQAICYVRPIQRDLCTKSRMDTNSEVIYKKMFIPISLQYILCY